MDSNLKLAAFPFATTIPTKLALTLWIQQRPKERNRHFREKHQSDILSSSTKAKVRGKDQIHLVPKIARPWGCSYPWLTLQGPLPAGPTRHSLPLLIDCQIPLCQTVSSSRKPCFSWCAPQIQFLSNFLPQVGSPGYREVHILIICIQEEPNPHPFPLGPGVSRTTNQRRPKGVQDVTLHWGQSNSGNRADPNRTGGLVPFLPNFNICNLAMNRVIPLTVGITIPTCRGQIISNQNLDKNSSPACSWFGEIFWKAMKRSWDPWALYHPGQINGFRAALISPRRPLSA